MQTNFFFQCAVSIKNIYNFNIFYATLCAKSKLTITGFSIKFKIAMFLLNYSTYHETVHSPCQNLFVATTNAKIKNMFVNQQKYMRCMMPLMRGNKSNNKNAYSIIAKVAVCRFFFYILYLRPIIMMIIIGENRITYKRKI
jgi:hypothetical protein